MTRLSIAHLDEIPHLSNLSTALGNVPFLSDQSIVAVLKDDKRIIGFAAAQVALHAAGSWIHEDYRKKGLTYALRSALEEELRRRGYRVYFALPNTQFERTLFAKYGAVTERLAQVREL